MRSLLLFATTLASAAAAAGKNLLLDGGFEGPLKGSPWKVSQGTLRNCTRPGMSSCTSSNSKRLCAACLKCLQSPSIRLLLCCWKILQGQGLALEQSQSALSMMEHVSRFSTSVCAAELLFSIDLAHAPLDATQLSVPRAALQLLELFEPFKSPALSCSLVPCCLYRFFVTQCCGSHYRL
jgi:hypothetical protein